MPGELVPELHDIGKLTDQWGSGEGHQFESFDFGRIGIRPDTPTWRGILEHHSGGHGLKYPTCSETFFCCIADNLASAASRGRQPSREEKGGLAHSVQRIWGLPKSGQFPFISSEEAALFVNEDSPAEAYFHRYGDLLGSRAEETRRPVTSLLTHSELTGKFYRLLSSAFRMDPEAFPVQDKDQATRLIHEKENEWRLTVAICQPHFLIKPFRARDLGVFATLTQALDEARARFADNILFATPERLLLVSSSPETINQIAGIFNRRGFWLEIVQAARSLSEFDQYDLVDALGRRPERVSEFPHLSDEIHPPICEACRMAAASRQWQDDGDDLCEICFSIREATTSLRNLARWEAEPVAWVHISLDLDGLIRTCQDLYAEYLEGHGKSASAAEVRFSLVAEFQRDYDAFLHKVRGDVLSRFGSPNVELLLPGLLCAKLESNRDIMGILGIFNSSIGDFFPKFREVRSSPVRLGISCSAAKFPFFQHWRLLEELEEDVLVHLTGRGEMRASLRALPEILTVAAMPNRSALHNLAEVAKISEHLARLKMRDGEDADGVSYRRLRERLLPFGLTHRGLLTLAKIAGG